MEKRFQKKIGVALVILALLVFSFGDGGKKAAAQDAFDNLRSVRWLVLGPFTAKVSPGVWAPWRNNLYHDHLGGEAEVELTEGQTAAGLTPVVCQAQEGMVDLQSVFPKKGGAAYAYLSIDSPKAQKMALKLGSDDGIRVWCNGRLLWTNAIWRMLTPGEDAVLLDLKPGKNRLLLKVDQLSGGWKFSAILRSLADEERDGSARPPAKLTISLPGLVFGKTEPTWCTVGSTPAFLTQTPVSVTVSDPAGRILSKAQGRLGEVIPFIVPSSHKGIFVLRASAKVKNAEVLSCPVATLAGDGAASAPEAVKRARDTARSWKPRKNGEDLAATLEFMADTLEGKVDPSLLLMPRALRALEAIDAICSRAAKGAWKTGTLTGLRQWAYRSTIDGSVNPYSVYLPETLQPNRRYSLLVMLHGYSGDDYNAVKDIVLATDPPEDFIIVGAFGRGDMFYRLTGEQDVLDVIDLVTRIYPVDPDRIYFTGLSMGGLGSWRFAQLYSDRIAAAAPFCGWNNTAYLENMLHVPALIVHGEKDTVVSPSFDRAAAVRLKDLGYNARYDEFPGVGHEDIMKEWVKRDGRSALFDYFRQYRRDPWPAKVVVQLKSNLRYGRSYWTRIEESSSSLCRLRAEVTDQKAIKIETKGVSVFSINMRHPQLAQKGEIKVTVNGTELSVPAGRERVVFAIEGGKTIMLPEVRSESLIATHYAGGFADLFFGPVACVYGTLREDRKGALKSAAEKITSLPQKVGSIPVWADIEIPPAGLRDRNLILIGGPEENRITADYIKSWGTGIPVQFQGDDVRVGDQLFTKSGLSFTYPNPDNRTRLVALIAFPFSENALVSYSFKLINYLNTGVNEWAADGMTYPDVMILKLPIGQTTQAWQFNRDWTKLSPYFYGTPW